MTTPDLQTVAIALAERSYHIAIRSSLFDNPLSYAELPGAQSALIVTNTLVGPLYAQRLQRALSGKFAHIHTVVLPDGEEHKTWQSLNLIFDALLATWVRPQDHAVCPGGRCGGRHDRLCRRQLHARRAFCAGAHHLAGSGGFIGGW
jgi:3-dehydroquinate synthetase